MTEASKAVVVSPAGGGAAAGRADAMIHPDKCKHPRAEEAIKALNGLYTQVKKDFHWA
jgi:hypothetical protein